MHACMCTRERPTIPWSSGCKIGVKMGGDHEALSEKSDKPVAGLSASAFRLHIRTGTCNCNCDRPELCKFTVQHKMLAGVLKGSSNLN